MLKALGARVIRTPAGVPSESDESIIGVARRRREDTSSSWILD